MVEAETVLCFTGRVAGETGFAPHNRDDDKRDYNRETNSAAVENLQCAPTNRDAKHANRTTPQLSRQPNPELLPLHHTAKAVSIARPSARPPVPP